MVSNCQLVFEGYSLPHPCLQAKTPSLSQPPLSSLSHRSPPPLTHQLPLLLKLSLFFFSVSPSLRPLRAAGSGRSLLPRSELITCILDRRATWGHTLPEDRSIHAGGNRKAQGPGGLGRGLGLGVGAGELEPKQERGGGGLRTGCCDSSCMSLKARAGGLGRREG